MRGTIWRSPVLYTDAREDTGSQTTTIIVGYHHRSEVTRETMMQEFANIGCTLHGKLHEIRGVDSANAGEMKNGSKSAPDTTGQYTQILACQIH